MTDTVLEVLVSSSVLIAALAVLRFFLRGKISARVQYALWLLAALRLLIPVSFIASPVSVMNVLPEAAMEPAVVSADPVYTPQWDAANTASVQADAAQEAFAAQEEAPAAQKENTSKSLSTETVLGLIWAAGSVLTLGFIVAQNLRAAKRLKKSRVRLDVPEAKIPVYITEKFAAPCLFGLVHPAVYLTKNAIDEDGNPDAFVLKHELTHYKRGDHIWCALRLLCLSAYWFDPFVWLAARLSKLDCELACDEAVLRDLNDLDRIAYGRALLGQVSPKRDRAYLAACATTMVSGKCALRTRIRRIANKQKTTAAALVLAVAVCAVLAACTFTNRVETTEPSTGGDLPAMVQVNGVLYQLDTATVGRSDSARVEVQGKIQSYVDYSEVPSEDDQANYPGVGHEYGMLDGQLVIKDKDGNWTYTLVHLPSNDVLAAALRDKAPQAAMYCTYSPCRLGTIIAAKRTNEDASMDVILMLAQKVDGEIQITQTETGRIDDAGYGVFQTQMAGQTIVFGVADQHMRETGSANMTSVDFNGVTLRLAEGSVSSGLIAAPGEPFQIGTYGDAEITSVRLTLGQMGDIAVFTNIPEAGEGGLATLTLGETSTDAVVSEGPETTDVDWEAIRQAVFEKFSTAHWDWDNLTEDEARKFDGTDSRENGMIGNYPNYYGAFADYFTAAGKAPSDEESWTLSLPQENLMALSIHQYGEQIQKLYYSLDTGTLCGLWQEPLVETDTRVGIGVGTDYADENIVVFHGYFGLFVYDLKESKITFSMDLGAATGTTNMQGGYAIAVFVDTEADPPEIMLTYCDYQRFGQSPLSYYIDTSTGSMCLAPTVYPKDSLAFAGTQLHNVEMVTDNVKDLTYSDGTKTWKLFESWPFGEQRSAQIVPLEG